MPKATVNDQLRLAGRTAIVTGAGRGIGRAIAELYAREGARVVIASRSADGCSAAVEAIEAAGGTAVAKPTDIGVKSDVVDMVGFAARTYGSLDILVNNAGIAIDRTVAKMTDEDWQRVIAVNLSGAFFMAQAALEHMMERGTGRIINVSSVIGETGNIGQVNYAASKSGLFGLTKSLAKEAIFQLDRAGRPVGDGIGLTVNAVTPGFIATDMLATIPDKLLDRIRSQIPVGRLGKPEEVAGLVAYLASEEAAFLTGANIAINGGQHMQ